MMKNLFIVQAKKSAHSVGGLARTFARTCNFRCVYIMRQHLFSKENEEQIPSDKKKKKKLCERLELFFMASSDIFSFLSIIRKKGINSEREKEKGKREDKKKKRGSLPF